LLLPHLGAAPLERAEIYFLDAARAMVEGGDWVIPRYEGEPFFDKPILAYWMMGAAMKGLGTSAGAGRLVAVAATIGVLLATAWLGTLLFDRRSALAGSLVLATTIAFLSFARVAMADMLLAAWTTLAVALAVLAFRPGAPAWTVPLLGVAAGLGFATKGPIALVVPGLALALLLWENRRLSPPCGTGPLALAALAFAVLGLGWFALVFRRLGPGPLVTFFFRENVERFAGEAYDVGRPAWFYVPAYLAEGLPWSPFLPIALFRLVRSPEGDLAPRARFLALWVAFLLVPLSLSRGKIDYYLLPAYPALSLLIGRYLAAVPWRRLDRTWAALVLLVEAGALAFVVARPPRIPDEWLPGALPRVLLVALLVAGTAALFAVAIRPTATRAAAVLASLVAASWLVLVVFFLPVFAAAQPNRAIVADVARELRYRPEARMAFCSDPTRVRRDVLLHVRLAAFSKCDLWSLAGSRAPFLLLATPAQDASFRVIPRYREVARYRYVPASALTLEGLFSVRTPGEIVLGANYTTSDPEAERKRKRAYRKEIKKARRAGKAAGHPRGRRGRPRGPAPSGGRPEGLGGGGDGHVDLRLPVGERDEGRLELRGREVDAPLEHGVEETGEALRVRFLRAGVVGDGARAEESRDHRPDAVDGHHGPGLARGPPQALLEPRAPRLERLVGPGLLEEVEERGPRRHRQRVPGEGAGLVDGAVGRHRGHDVRAPAVGRGG
jgi:4-amino-4-deoxy-L-arabinose transferase